MKREFVDDLFRLTPSDLAKIIETLNDRCESCLDKVIQLFFLNTQTNPELVDIIVDAIDNATFHFVFDYVKELLKKSNPSTMEVENYFLCSQIYYWEDSLLLNNMDNFLICSFPANNSLSLIVTYPSNSCQSLTSLFKISI